MVRYYKYVNDGYIIMVGVGAGFTAIDEEEYQRIINAIKQKPADDEKIGYRLKEDLTYEAYELPVIEDGNYDGE